MQATQQQTTPEATTSKPVQQDCSMTSTPQKEHEWLQRFIGQWEGEGEAAMGPEQSTAKWKTSETVRSLQGLWIVAEGNGEMPGGGTATTIVTLGYDPKKGRYVGTFVGSMMHHLWVYEGTLDSTGAVLTLDTEGPGMTPDTASAKYQDVIAFESDDVRTLTSFILGEGGQRQQIMKATYRRVR